MKKNRKATDFLNEPHYEGGNKAIDSFIGSHLIYPKEALKNKISGDVEIKYDINHKGKVIATKVTKGIGSGCDEEACRLVEMLRFDVHVPRGIKATFHRNIKIHFRLPKAQMSYSYNVAPKKVEASGSKQIKKAPSTYSYSIKIQKKTDSSS